MNLNRKHWLAALTIAALTTACSGENAEKAASGAVAKAVEVAKGASTGIGKGVEEGRKASTSADGAVIVTTGKELAASLSGEVLDVEAGESAAVTLGFSNTGDAPVRVTDLAMNGHVTALDDEGYACTSIGVTNEFTVPAKAKLKYIASFNCGKQKISKVRLFDVEYAVAKR